jgi:ABC-type lipopolysaccharide export system ATPase subunit
MPLQVEKIREILSEEKASKGILITDHLYQEIIDCSDRIYLLSEGKTHLARTLEDIERLGYIPRH